MVLQTSGSQTFWEHVVEDNLSMDQDAGVGGGGWLMFQGHYTCYAFSAILFSIQYVAYSQRALLALSQIINHKLKRIRLFLMEY